MPEDVRRHKIFVVRSLLYGAALMFDNGELLYTPENLESMRRLVNHEIDLPKPRSQKSAPPFWQSALQTIRHTTGTAPKEAAPVFILQYYSACGRARPASARTSHCRSLEAMSENTCSFPCSFRISCRILG